MNRAPVPRALLAAPRCGPFDKHNEAKLRVADLFVILNDSFGNSQ